MFLGHIGPSDHTAYMKWHSKTSDSWVQLFSYSSQCNDIVNHYWEIIQTIMSDKQSTKNGTTNLDHTHPKCKLNYTWIITITIIIIGQLHTSEAAQLSWVLKTRLHDTTHCTTGLTIVCTASCIQTFSCWNNWLHNWLYNRMYLVYAV